MAAAAGRREFKVGDGSQVFVVKRHGGAYRLTHGPEPHGAPVWSRRGQRIALSTSHEIQIRALDGDVRHKIRGGRLFTGQVAWSPDDRRVAFVSYRSRLGHVDETEGALVVSDVDGERPRVLARDAVGRPDWTADGKTVLYRRGQLWSRADQGIRAVRVRDGKAKRIAKGAAYNSRVLVSPDGAWVLFQRLTRSRRRGLWIVHPDGSGERRIVGRDGSYGSSYGWILGGRAVFGGKYRGRQPVVAFLSGEHRRLQVGFDSELYDVSPDGRRVAWATHDDAGVESALHLAGVDGTGNRTLAHFRGSHNSVDVEVLSWSPDGKRLVIDPYQRSGD